MLRGTGALRAKGLAGHSEAYRCYSVAQGQAGEALKGGCGHGFTIGGLSDDLLRALWALSRPTPLPREPPWGYHDQVVWSSPDGATSLKINVEAP